MYKKSLNLNKKIYGNEYPEVATNLSNLGVKYNRRGKLSQAETLLKSALDMRIKLRDENHPQTSNALIGLGNALILTKSFAEADEKINKGIEIYKNKLPADHWNISYAESMLANVIQGKVSMNRLKTYY